MDSGCLGRAVPQLLLSRYLFMWLFNVVFVSFQCSFTMFLLLIVVRCWLAGCRFVVGCFGWLYRLCVFRLLILVLDLRRLMREVFVVEISCASFRSLSFVLS